MNHSWTPLWSKVVDSSLWDEPDMVVKVFMTMLALKDSDHIYHGSAYSLARQSRKTEEEVLEALRVLASPDTKRKEAQEFGGRRIRAVEDGWLILNGEKYRKEIAIEMRRASWRKAQAKRRERIAKVDGKVFTKRMDTVDALANKLIAEGKPEEAERLIEIENRRIELMCEEHAEREAAGKNGHGTQHPESTQEE